MRGAALADLHLGFRAFSATDGGRNAREVDVERAWHQAVEQVVAAKPDLVTIAGDVFHNLKVTDYARMAFLVGIRRILSHTNAAVIIVQGNHEAARTIESLTPIALASVFLDRVWVVTTPKRVRLRTSGEEVSVACFPFTTRTDGETFALEPDPDADVNVLVVHAAVRGDAAADALPRFYGSDQSLDVGKVAGEWDAVCCGDYHEFTRLHPTGIVFYSGAIERTSSNIWQEVQPKGWVLYDTAAKTMEFREVATRPVVEIALREGEDAIGASELNIVLRGLCYREDLSGAIVRLKVEGFPRDEREQIDQDLIRALRGRCLHFVLDIRYAAPVAADLGDRRTREGGLSLAGELVEFMREDPPEVLGLAVRMLGLETEVAA